MLTRIKKFIYVLNRLQLGNPKIIKMEDESRLILLLKNLNILEHCATYEKNPQKKSCILSIKIPQIESLMSEDIVLNKATINLYRPNKTILVYDLSTEALTFTDYSALVLKRFHEILQKTKINPNDVILVCANSVAETHYTSWAKNNFFQNYKIKMLGYDFYFYEYFWELNRCAWLKKNKSNLLLNSYQTTYKNQKRNKHFMCLNLRPRWHRTALMLHLLEKNHHHKGYVTYFGKEFADHSSVSTRDETIYHIEQLQSASRLLPLLETLDNMSPMILDRNSDAIRNDLWLRKPGEVDFLFPDIQASPTGNIDSYFEIVTETWFTDDTVSYITEKTIRPIVRLQPFIHIGTPFLLANLQAKGFKTFSPYINEEYDAIIDPTKRLEAIFTEIDRLCSLTLEEIHKIYTALWPTLIFNFNHYFDNARKYARKDIGHNILKKFERNYNKIHN